jgi:hypothetical protein
MEDFTAALYYIWVNIGRLCGWFVGDCHMNHWKLFMCLAFTPPQIIAHSDSADLCFMEAATKVLSNRHLCLPEKVHVRCIVLSGYIFSESVPILFLKNFY